MKKTLIIMTTFIICILLTGCGTTKEENILNNNITSFKDLGDLGVTIQKYSNLKCDVLQDIVDYELYHNFFITNDGKLYQLSFNKLYSNDSNCKQIESDKIFKRFIKSGIIDNENNIYEFNNINKTLEEFNFEPGHTSMPYIQNISKSDYDNIILAELSNEELYYFKVVDNKIYKYNESFTLENEPSLVLENNEEIISILDGGIRTNKNYYNYSKRATNKEECEKYADIKCNYETSFDILDNKKITSQLNNIKFIKTRTYFGQFGCLIIDSNNNVYISYVI